MPARERREQILDAAEIVFSANSYRDVGTASVAAQAEVSEPTLYRYFESKRDLYLAMLDRSAERLLSGWREQAANNPSPLGGIADIGTGYYQQIQDDPSPFLLRARSLLETGDAKLAEHARKRFWETYEFIVSLYERARECGEIAADADVHSHAWLFMAMGGLLDQFLLLDIELLDLSQIGRMMRQVAPSPERAAKAAGHRSAKPLKKKRSAR